MNKLSGIKLAALILIVLLSACKKEEVLNTNIEGLGGENVLPGAIDIWIRDSLTTPYNIDVQYRWDAFEMAMDKTLVPPYQENILPILRMVKYGWIEAYEQAVSPAFIKTLCPKQYFLVGSVAYNPSGSIIVGEAENGRKVTLYRINQLKPKDSVFAKRILKTIHHEFGHILQNASETPKEFKFVTPDGYVSNWASFTEDNARSLGFISPYAMSDPDEDFVEMISIMLSEGRGRYETLLKNLPAAALTSLRRKEQLVVDFYRQSFNIDFYALQAVAYQKLKKVLQ